MLVSYYVPDTFMNWVYTISNHFIIILWGGNYYSHFIGEETETHVTEMPGHLFKVPQLDVNPALPEPKGSAFSSLMCAVSPTEHLNISQGLDISKRHDNHSFVH